MAKTWTDQKVWQQLTPYQRAAAMALMEADGRNIADARNVLGAIINRAENEKADLGWHVSQPIYQPTIEPAQFARLPSILRTSEFQQLTELAQRRAERQEPDWVQGATHFLAPEKTMLSLRQREPDKYHNWGPFPNSKGIPGRNWTGYDPATGAYKGVIFRDKSHAFLIPGTDQKPAEPGAPALAPVAAAPQPTPATPALGTAPPTGLEDVRNTAPAAPQDLPPTGINPRDPTASLLPGLAAYWEGQLAKDAESKKRGAADLALAQGAYSDKAPGASPMIQGPRTPRVDVRGMLEMLKGQGVNPGAAGVLAFGLGPLGTIRKGPANG